jgi:lipoyl(octanoyl) transferase
MRVIDLGSNVSYADGLAAMRSAMAEVDSAGPTLLLHELRPTITITRHKGLTSFVSPRAAIEADGIDVVEADRGGDVTYHGPGQLTAYPILRLGPTSLGTDVVGFVRAIEAAVIDAIAVLGVDSGHSIMGKDAAGHMLTGVWANEAVVDDETMGCSFHMVSHVPKKLCAIGVGLGGGVTRHGFALNVSTALERYTAHIVPCGLSARGVTSLERLLPRPPPMERVKAVVVDAVIARLVPLHRPLASS